MKIKILILIFILAATVGCSRKKYERGYHSPTWAGTSDTIYCVEIEHCFRSWYIMGDGTEYIDSYLFSMNTSGGNTQRIIELISEDNRSIYIDKISIVNNLIVYSCSSPDAGTYIWSKNIDGTNEKSLVTKSEIPSGKYVSNPELSPNKEKIIYRISGYDGLYELWIMNVDGTGKSKIWQDDINYSIRWSTDSYRIAISTSSTTEATTILNINTLENHVVLSIDDSEFPNPQLSSDGTNLIGEEGVYDYNHNGIWISKKDGSNYEIIASPSGDVFSETSCPYIYSFNGKEYVPDAQIYIGAIFKAIEKTDYIKLEHLKALDGKYLLKLTEELPEIDHTDSLKLMIVDHPKNIDIVTDKNGDIYTLSSPQSPLTAVTFDGNDVMRDIRKKDNIFWTSKVSGRDPEKEEDLRDKMIIEFSKPVNAKTLKLVVNGNNTDWGGSIYRRLHDMLGNKVRRVFDDVERNPELYKKVYDFDSRCAITITLWENNEWQFKGYIRNAGTFSCEDNLFLIDVSKIKGNKVKIQLETIVMAWKIDSVLVDYSKDIPVKITELNLYEASDKRKRDIRNKLMADDNNYFITRQGDWAMLSFKELPLKHDMDRAFIIKGRGYYKISGKGKGPENLELFKKLVTEPGAIEKYSLTEYLKRFNLVAKK